MEENPLDLELHEEETLWDAWKRRLMFALLIALCITFAAPSFGGCSDALGTGGALAGSYVVAGERVEVSQEEFESAYFRFRATTRLLGAREQDGDEGVWSHILMNAAAEAEGVYVPQSAIDQIVERVGQGPTGGDFDVRTYHETLRRASNGRLTDAAFTRTIAELLRINEYRSVYQTAFSLVPSRTAFERWQTQNEKISVSYVARSFSALRDDVAALEPTDDELRDYGRTPAASAKLRISPQKVVEVAYLRVRDMSEVQLTEIENFLRDEGAIDADPKAVDTLGLREYHGGRDTIYTRQNWLAGARVRYSDALKLHADRVKAWEDGGKQGDAPVTPPDPTLDTPPEDFVERYQKYWRAPILKEVLGREFLALFAARAEREGKSFADLAQDLEVLGVQVTQNDKPLSDTDFSDKFPDDLGRESELASVVRTSLRGPTGDKTFTPSVHTVPVPTTRLGSALDDRGYMVVRLAGFTPSRIRELDEARDEILEMWREYQVRDRARKQLEAMREKVTAGDMTLEEAAQADGLEVRVLRRFNQSTPERALPITAPDETPDPALEQAREAIQHRNRVVRDYPFLTTTEPGSFRKSVLLDDRSEGAYLIRVDEKSLPTPQEIQPYELRAARLMLMQELGPERVKLASDEELARRFQLELTKPEKPADTGDDEDEQAAR